MDVPCIPQLSGLYLTILCPAFRASPDALRLLECRGRDSGVPRGAGSFHTGSLIYFFPRQPLDIFLPNFADKHSFSNGVDCAIFRDFRSISWENVPNSGPLGTSAFFKGTARYFWLKLWSIPSRHRTHRIRWFSEFLIKLDNSLQSLLVHDCRFAQCRNRFVCVAPHLNKYQKRSPEEPGLSFLT